MITNMEELNDTLRFSAEDGNLLGFQVFWMLSHVNIGYRELEEAVRRAGMNANEHCAKVNPGIMPRRVTPCSAWSRAVVDLKKHEYVKEHDLLVDMEHIQSTETAGPKGLLTIHSKKVDGGEASVKFKQQFSYMFDKLAGYSARPEDVIVPQQSDGSEKIYQMITDQYARCLNSVNYADCLSMIHRMLDQAQAFCMKPSGGLYFVPAVNRDLVESLEKIVNVVGHSHLYVLDLPRATRNVETVKKTAQEALAAEIDQLKREIDEAVKHVNLNGDQHGHIRTRMMLNLDALNKRVAFYDQILEHHHEQFKETLSAYSEKVSSMV